MDKAQSQAPTRSLVSIDDVGNATAFLALDGAKLITGDVMAFRSMPGAPVGVKGARGFENS